MRYAQVPLELTMRGPAVTQVYVCLARYANSDRQAWPEIARLARDAGLSARTIRRCLAQLEEGGYITKHRRTGKDGRTTSNLYILTPLTENVQGANLKHAGPMPVVEAPPAPAPAPEPAPTPAVQEEPKPKQTTEAALIVARHWKTPTTQSKAVIATTIAKALKEFPEEQVVTAVRLLSENSCHVNDFSLGQAIHGKVVNGPNAGKKMLEADRTDLDYGGTTVVDPVTGFVSKVVEL